MMVKTIKNVLNGSSSTPFFDKWVEVSLYEYHFIEFALTFKITNDD